MQLPLTLNRVHDADVHPRGDSSRFTDVLYSCVGQVGAGHTVRPACDTLHRVDEADIEAFRHEQPRASEELETHLARALERVRGPDAYRSLGLYMALLAQDIDLAHSATGRLGHGPAAETAARLGAIMRQSLRVRDERTAETAPIWAIVVIAVLGAVVLGAIILVIVFGVAIAAPEPA